MKRKADDFKDSDKLIGQLANYLKDACQEVRASSKRAFVSLQNAVMGQNDLEKLKSDASLTLNETFFSQLADAAENGEGRSLAFLQVKIYHYGTAITQFSKSNYLIYSILQMKT